MPTAYLSPSLLQDLTNVSVSPGAGNTGYPLVWNNATGQFELAVLGVAGGGTGTSNGSITGTGALTFAAGGTNQNITLLQSGTGRIGIGTSSPASPVDLRGNTRICGNSGAVGNSSYALSLQNNSSATWLEILNNAGANQGAFFGVTGNDFHLWNFQGGNTVFYNGVTPGSSLERLRITGAGNVGIGTSAPTSALTIAATTESTSTTTGAVRIDGGAGIAKNVNIGGNLRFAGGTVPATAASAGTTGDIRYDGSHLYICTATNTWVRTALSTW